MSSESELEAMVQSVAIMNETIEKMVRRAYDLGFREGGIATRESILRAAGAPMAIGNGRVNIETPENGSVSPPEVKQVQEVSGAERDRRAPRGLVAEAIKEILTDNPGLSIIDIEDRVVEAHPLIARKSVGNQLRRGEGDTYRREGKYKWFLNGAAVNESAREGEIPGLADPLGWTERR
jgi:hypothetical protein